MMKTRTRAAALVALAALSLTGCSRLDGSYYAENGTYRDVDLAAENKITFRDGAGAGAVNITVVDDSGKREPNFPQSDESTFPVRVRNQLQVYSAPGDSYPSDTISAGELVSLVDSGLGDWLRVRTSGGLDIGYVKDGFMHTMAPGCTLYGELPIEYGQAKTNEGTYVDAYSHLVDVRRYFRCYESTDENNEGVDFTQYDLKISMKLSTSDTSIAKPFYNRNLCMLQYDILPMLKRAIDIFAADGYRIVIYDAYRPTSVQQRWFDVVRVHKWVADPSIGMGGVHDRGTAIDMSLIDMDGNELEMPTPMHTFTEDSARDSRNMTETARQNMDYMKNVMVGCGFTYINSEWWHFQDVNTKYYLPTDHPIDTIPLVPSE